MWWQRVIETSPYLIIVFAFLMLRVLQVFTKHQQKMAEILNRTAADHTEIASLRQDVAELKALVQNQSSNQTTPPVPIAERLNA